MKKVLNMFVMPVLLASPPVGVFGDKVEGVVELEVTEVMDELEGDEREPLGDSIEASDDNLIQTQGFPGIGSGTVVERLRT